jgi:hypothetical protein
MLKKHAILIGIILSLVLLYLATLHYPGGSQADKNSVGYDWLNNYLSNLFSPKAVNGAENTARIWADLGMLFFCSSLLIFYIDFSAKIPDKNAKKIIKYCGIGSMVFAFLAVTPYHDEAVRLSCILSMLAIFYVTVFVLKSKLTGFKVLSIVFLVSLYGGAYVYFSRNGLQMLPVLQKVTLGISIIWVLGLSYFTTSTDFTAKMKVAA